MPVSTSWTLVPQVPTATPGLWVRQPEQGWVSPPGGGWSEEAEGEEGRWPSREGGRGQGDGPVPADIQQAWGHYIQQTPANKIRIFNLKTITCVVNHSLKFAAFH